MPVNDMWSSMSPNTDASTVRRHRKNVRGPPQRRHGDPAGVGREAHVLDAGRRVAAVQSVQVVDGGERRSAGVRMHAEQVKVVTPLVGREQQHAAGVEFKGDDRLRVGGEVRYYRLGLNGFFGDVAYWILRRNALVSLEQTINAVQP